MERKNFEIIPEWFKELIEEKFLGEWEGIDDNDLESKAQAIYDNFTGMCYSDTELERAWYEVKDLVSLELIWDYLEELVKKHED